jgi:hypothetical protein
MSSTPPPDDVTKVARRLDPRRDLIESQKHDMFSVSDLPCTDHSVACFKRE